MMNEQLEMNFNKLVVNNTLTVEHLAFGGGGLVAKVYVDKQLSIQEQLEKYETEEAQESAKEIQKEEKGKGPKKLKKKLKLKV